MILDSSAVLAFIKGEVGAEITEAALAGAAMSAVNWTEVVAKVAVAPPRFQGALAAVEIAILAFDEATAVRAGQLLARHRGVLSLGDCACLATAEVHGLPVLTADRIWAGLGLPVEVRLIR